MASPKRQLLGQIRTYNSPNRVHFEFRSGKDFTPSTDVKGNFAVLIRRHSFRNMIALDAGIPRKFSCPAEILSAFCERRLVRYGVRLEFLRSQTERSLRKFRGQLQYLDAIYTKRLPLRVDEERLEFTLRAAGLAPFEGTFAYLLDLPSAWLMSQDKTDKLQKKVDALETHRVALINAVPRDLWKQDLKAFGKEYRKFLKTADQRDDGS